VRRDVPDMKDYCVKRTYVEFYFALISKIAHTIVSVVFDRGFRHKTVQAAVDPVLLLFLFIIITICPLVDNENWPMSGSSF